MRELNKDEFKAKVCDYEKSGGWEYLGDRPCVLEFKDDSCAPCRAMRPVLDGVSHEFGNRVEFYVIDIQKEEQLAKDLGIDGLPYMVLCTRDKSPAVIKGYIPREKLRAAIEEEFFGISTDS